MYYGGSFYDDLKIGKPEEYDLDILLKVPKVLSPELVFKENKPGFLEIQLKSPDILDQDPVLKYLIAIKKNLFNSNPRFQEFKAVFRW